MTDESASSDRYHEWGERRTRADGDIVYWQCRKCGVYGGFW